MKKKYLINFITTVFTLGIPLSSYSSQWAERAPSSPSIKKNDFVDINVNNSEEVRFVFNNISEKLIKEYNQKSPLAFEMMDGSDPAMLRFLNAVTNRKNDGHLTLSYFKKFLVDGKEMPMCFVFYDPNQQIFSQYMKSGFTQEETFSYLSSHELGHCFFDNMGIKTDAKGSEILADIFAISHSLNNNLNNQAVKILKNLKNIENSDDKIHDNFVIIEKFFLQVTNENVFANKKDPQEILELALSFLKKEAPQHFKTSFNK